MTSGRARRAFVQRSVLVAAVLLGLVAAPAHATYPGKNGRLAFTRDGAIVSSTATGGGAKRLAPASSMDPSWSPNGRKIVYVKLTEGVGGFGRVFTMNADGSGKKRLGAESRYSNPQFSPDGKKIIVTEYDGNAMGTEHLLVMNADGSNRKVFAPKVKGGMGYGAWSPDGSTVAYVSGSGDLYRIRADGAPSTVKKLANGAADPDWSPNGKLLVFTRYNSKNNSTTVHRISATGSGLRKLADFGANSTTANAAWSPNGKLISYSRATPDYKFHLYTMKPDGSSKTLRVRNALAASWQPVK
jgi:TolB protein